MDHAPATADRADVASLIAVRAEKNERVASIGIAQNVNFTTR